MEMGPPRQNNIPYFIRSRAVAVGDCKAAHSNAESDPASLWCLLSNEIRLHVTRADDGDGNLDLVIANGNRHWDITDTTNTLSDWDPMKYMWCVTTCMQVHTRSHEGPSCIHAATATPRARPNELHKGLGNGNFTMVTDTTISGRQLATSPPAAQDSNDVVFFDMDGDGDVRAPPPPACAPERVVSAATISGPDSARVRMSRRAARCVGGECQDNNVSDHRWRTK